MNIKPGTSVAITCLIFWVLLLTLLFTVAPITPMFPRNWSRCAFGILGLLCSVFVTWLMLLYEKRSFKEIGLVWQAGTLMRFVKGLLIGTAIFGVILSALVILTPLRLERNTGAFAFSALLGYLAFIPLSLMEEIGFRAYTFKTLDKQFGLRITQVITAIVFALYHVAGGQALAGSFLGPGIYAFVFGLAAVWSGGIAMPFGIHLALNLLQPLTGMRGDSGAVWVLKPGGVSPSMATPEMIGVAMQWVVLIVTLLLTEYYIRKVRSAHPKK